MEFVVPYDRAPAPLGDPYVIRRSRTLLDRDVSHPRDLRSTDVDRTYCDLSAVSPTPLLPGLLIDGRQRQLTSITRVMRRQALMAGTSGLPRLRRIAYELDATKCDSVLAWRARRLLVAAGIPPDRA